MYWLGRQLRREAMTPSCRRKEKVKKKKQWGNWGKGTKTIHRVGQRGGDNLKIPRKTRNNKMPYPRGTAGKNRKKGSEQGKGGGRALCLKDGQKVKMRSEKGMGKQNCLGKEKNRSAQRRKRHKTESDSIGPFGKSPIRVLFCLRAEKTGEVGGESSRRQSG